MYWEYYEGERVRSEYVLRGVVPIPPLWAMEICDASRKLILAFSNACDRIRDRAIGSLLRAEISIRDELFDIADAHVLQAKELAMKIDAQDLLCWHACILCHSAIDRRLNELPASTEQASNRVSEAADAVDEAIISAREYGFSIWHAELNNVRACIDMLQGDPVAAEQRLRNGVLRKETTGKKEMSSDSGDTISDLAVEENATQFPSALEANYAWGVAVGEELLNVSGSLSNPPHEPTQTAGRNLKIRLPIATCVHSRRYICTHDAIESEAASMKDFFISYNGKDRDWAEWIAWTLEEEGYTVTIQAWDFRPGSNFVLEMQKAVTDTRKTIAVLSDNYLAAEYTQPEWAVAFAQDPKGEKRKLVPVRVKECQPSGLLGMTVYVDLVGLGEEDALTALLGAFSDGVELTSAPPFPVGSETGGGRTASTPRKFPGGSPSESLMGKLKNAEPLPPESASQQLSPEERLALIQRLNLQPPQQFNMLVFALKPPPGTIPPMPTPQGDRSAALLDWAEGTGCGLTTVVDVLNRINPQ